MPELVLTIRADGATAGADEFEAASGRITAAAIAMMESMDNAAQAQTRMQQASGDNATIAQLKKEITALKERKEVVQTTEQIWMNLHRAGMQALKQRTDAQVVAAKKEADASKLRISALAEYNRALKAIDAARTDKETSKQDGQRLAEIEARRKKDQADLFRYNRNIALMKQKAAADTERQTQQERAAYERLIISMGGVAAQAIKVARAEKILNAEVARGAISKHQATAELTKYKLGLKEADATTRTAKQGIQELVGSFAVLGFGPLSGIGSRIIAFNRILKVTTDQANLLKHAMIGLTTVLLAVQGAFAVFRFFRDVAADLDKTVKTADRLGVTLQEYQALDFAAQRAGLDGIEQAFRRMKSAIGDTVRVSGEARSAFNDLGIEVDELRQLEPIEQLATIAEAFKQLNDIDRTQSIAKELFGARESRAINLLLTGSKGIHELVDDAKRLGIVFEGSGRQAEAITDRLLEMDLMMKVLKQTLVAELFPAFLTFATLLQNELGGAISFVLQMFGILTTSTLTRQFEEVNYQLEKLAKKREEVAKRGTIENYVRGALEIDPTNTGLLAREEQVLRARKGVLGVQIAARNLTSLEQAEGLLRAIKQHQIDIGKIGERPGEGLIFEEFSDEELDAMRKGLGDAIALIQRYIDLRGLIGRDEKVPGSEASKSVLSAVERFRKLARETERAYASITALNTGADRFDIAKALRLDEAVKEAQDFIGEIAKLEDKVNNLKDLRQFAERTENYLGVSPDDIRTEAEGIDLLTDALGRFINKQKILQEFEAFRTGLQESKDDYEDQLLIIRALGADHDILASRLEREQEARKILGGEIDANTMAMIDELEVLERELVRKDRLKEFGQDLEDGIRDPIERALAGGIDSFEDFFDAVTQSWRATLAKMFADQIFSPENFGFASGGGIGGFFNSLGFGFGDAITPRHRAIEASIHDTAGSVGITAANTKVLGEIGSGKFGDVQSFFGTSQADLDFIAAEGVARGTVGDGGGLSGGTGFTGILGALALGGISYLIGQNKPFDIEASGAERVAANTAILGASTAAALALGGLAASAGLVSGTLGSVLIGLAAIAPYLILIAALAAVAILLVDVFSTPPRDIELNLRTTETQEELFRRSHQAGSRGAFREGPFGFIGLHVQSGPGDAQELQWQQTLLESILKLDQAIAKTLLPEEIERVALVLQNANKLTRATPAGIENLLDQVLFRGVYAPDYVSPAPTIIPGPGMGIRWRDSKGYLRESNGDYFEDKFGTQDWQKPWTQQDIDELSRLISQSPIFESGNIHSVLTRDPTNDIGYVIARRVELAFAALNMDAGFFGLDVASTGGFIPDDYFQTLSEVMKVRIEYIRSLDTLAGEPVTDAIKNIRQLDDQFEEMSALAEALGFTIEDLVARYEVGREVLNQNFLLGVETAIFEITDPFVAVMEGIRSTTEVLLRNALDYELDPQIVLDLNDLRINEALEQALAPVTGVLEAIQIDRVAPLETLEILEARFQAALVSQDPGEIANTATALIGQLEKTFGRTQDYFEASAVIEEQLLQFNDELRSIAAIQLDLVRDQLAAIMEGNATQAEMLQVIRDTWGGITGPSAAELWPIPPEGFYGTLGDDVGSAATVYTAAEAFAAVNDQMNAQIVAQYDLSQRHLNVAEAGFETLAQLLQNAVDELRLLRGDGDNTADVIDLAQAKKATA